MSRKQIPAARPIHNIIGPFDSKVEAPMYSFERPSRILWQAVYDAMIAEGCTHEEAIDWLQSKTPRHELDGKLGDDLHSLGLAIGRECARDAKSLKPKKKGAQCSP